MRKTCAGASRSSQLSRRAANSSEAACSSARDVRRCGRPVARGRPVGPSARRHLVPCHQLRPFGPTFRHPRAHGPYLPHVVLIRMRGKTLVAQNPSPAKPGPGQVFFTRGIDQPDIATSAGHPLQLCAHRGLGPPQQNLFRAGAAITAPKPPVGRQYRLGVPAQMRWQGGIGSLFLRAG